jgi:hypothetical protein
MEPSALIGQPGGVERDESDAAVIASSSATLMIVET